MDKWLSVSQLSEVTEIPETTIRRYASKFSKYFRYEQRGRGKKYHPETIEIIKKIVFLYDNDYDAVKIDEILGQEFAFVVEGDKDETTNQPLIKPLDQQFEEFKAQQEEFNRQLLQELQEHKDYIKNSLDRRDGELMNGMNQLLETKKQIAAVEEKDKEKKWWQFWK